MNIFIKISLGLLSLVITSCASNQAQLLTEKQIENICQNKRLQATKPTTNLSLATGSEGPKYQIGITMSSDFITGRDPNEVYNQCKMSLSL